MKKETLEEQLYKIGWISAGIIVPLSVLYLYLVRAGVNFVCYFHRFFGLYCPGCGGTRAVVALMHAHPLQSAWYHPLVPYTAVLFGLFMGSHLLEHLHIGKIRGLRFRNWYLWVAVGITAANWILKNVLLIFFHVTL